MPSWDLQVFKGSTASKHELLDGQAYLDEEKGSLTIKVDGTTSEFRPGGVGLDADKPSNLREGESYFASDSYILYYGGKKDSFPFSVQGFPYHYVRTTSAGFEAVTLFVDPTNGDDNNYGGSLGAPCKTISGAFLKLPQNLLGKTVYLFLFPGTYDGDQIKRPYNCVIEIYPIESSLVHQDSSNNPSEIFGLAKGNTEMPIDGDVVFTKTSGGGAGFIVEGSPLFPTTVKFFAYKHNLTWDADQFLYDGMIKFKNDSNASLEQLLAVHNYADVEFAECVPHFDMGLTTQAGIINTATVRMHLFKVIGGTGGASTGTSSWKGFFFGHTNNFYITDKPRSSGSGGINAFDGLTYAESKSIRWDGVHNISYVWLGGNAVFELTGYVASDWAITNGQLGGAPQMNLYLLGGTSFNVEIDPTQISEDITETGYSSYRYKNLSTGVETVMTEAGIQKLGNSRKIAFTGNFILESLPTSNPAVAGALWNDSGTVKVSAG